MKPVFAALIATTILAALTANAQDQPKQPAAPQPANHPGLGEIMALQQMRHSKLWFAGRAGNWPLADYEMGELNEGFDDVNKLLGGDTVQKAIAAQMTALEKIVDAKDRAAFTAAFDKSHRRLQRLPPRAGSRLYRHSASDVATLRQPIVHRAIG